MYKVGLFHPSSNRQGLVVGVFFLLNIIKTKAKKKINFYDAKADQFHFLLHVMHCGML